MSEGYTDAVIPKPEWISVDKGLPKSGEKVLAYCWVKWLSGGGKGYVCDAYYAAPKSVLASEGWDDCATEYDEETDEYYLLSGWYEVIHNWDEYGSIAIGDFVTHWMPMPSEPRMDK